MNPRATPPRFIIPVLLAGPLAACGSGRDANEVVTDSVYVEVMTRLVLLRERFDETRVSQGERRIVLDSAELAIAEDLGVTGDDLLDFSERAGRDPRRMARLWEAIAARADSLRDEAPGETAVEGAPLRPVVQGQDTATRDSVGATESEPSTTPSSSTEAQDTALPGDSAALSGGPE